MAQRALPERFGDYAVLGFQAEERGGIGWWQTCIASRVAGAHVTPRRWPPLGCNPRELLDDAAQPAEWVPVQDGQSVPVALAVCEWDLPVDQAVQIIKSWSHMVRTGPPPRIPTTTRRTPPMTITDLDLRPPPQTVGARAAEILDAIKADADYERLASSTSLYASCWSTFTGYPIVANFDLDTDTAPLLVDALKVLALKSAVFELTDGDETAAELLVSAPVDEMVHAVLAQHTLVVQLERRIGIDFVHMTDQERFGWDPGDYTDRCYRAAGWGTPPERYWIPAAEAARRQHILDARYESIGVTGGGRRVNVDFEAPAA